MRNLLILLISFTFNQVISQEIVDLKEVYIENKLVYKNTTDKLFSGIAQHKRRNGHLVYEEEYMNGIILTSNVYFNGKEIRVSKKTIYNSDKPTLPLKEIDYNLDGQIFETITYNEFGVKILREQFKNGKLTYSCEYLGKKKHGFEIGYNENGEIKCQTEYRNGKRVK